MSGWQRGEEEESFGASLAGGERSKSREREPFDE